MTGIVLQQAGGDSLVFSIPCSVLSHPVIDSLNWSPDADALYHGLGTGRLRWLGIGARIGLGLLLCLYLYRHPVYLTCGLISWLSWDFEHIVRFLFKRDLRLHERMFPSWLKSEAGVILTLCAMIVLLGLVTQ